MEGQRYSNEEECGEEESFFWLFPTLNSVVRRISGGWHGTE